MEIARYVDGRILSYDADLGQFAVGGAPVGMQDVLEYDAAGQIAWATESTRSEWTAWILSAQASLGGHRSGDAAPVKPGRAERSKPQGSRTAGSRAKAKASRERAESVAVADVLTLGFSRDDPGAQYVGGHPESDQSLPCAFAREAQDLVVYLLGDHETKAIEKGKPPARASLTAVRIPLADIKGISLVALGPIDVLRAGRAVALSSFIGGSLGGVTGAIAASSTTATGIEIDCTGRSTVVYLISDTIGTLYARLVKLALPSDIVPNKGIEQSATR